MICIVSSLSATSAFSIDSDQEKRRKSAAKKAVIERSGNLARILAERRHYHWNLALML
jgi:hypothetical protein